MLSLKTALRFIKKTPIQSLVILLSVIIGIGVQFFILSLGSILRVMILEQSTAYQEQILVETSNIDVSIREKLLTENTEITYAIYTTDVIGTISNEKLSPVGFKITGADSDYQSFYGLNIEKHLKSGRLNDPHENEIMLDDYFAKRNNIKADEIIFFTKQNHETISLLVTGTFDLGVYRSTRNYGYLNLDLLNLDASTNYQLKLQVKDPMAVELTTAKLLNYFPNNEVTTWKDLTPELNVLSIAQNAVILVIEVFISIAVFVVILSVITFSIQQKYKQLGIMRAIGATQKDISKIFILQSLFISLLGIIIGLIAGTITMILYEDYMVYPDGTPRFTVSFDWYNYVIAIGLILLTVLTASYFAIRKIKKLPIIELIKI